jgi:prepilin-type N-terminal cleavage/methylation domain-containing protein
LKRNGFTLVELLLALGLFSLILVVLMRLLDATLATMGQASGERERFVREGALLNFVARDFDSLAGGAAADLLVSTRRFDVDGDGIAGRPWPRLVFVRQVPPQERFSELGNSDPSAALTLSEVVWTVLPRSVPRRSEGAPGRRGDGILVRSERLLSSDVPSLFSPAAYAPTGQPLLTYEEVQTGILWLEVLCAAQTTRLEEGWQVGSNLESASPSWDARGGARLAGTDLRENELHPALPGVPVSEPLLPRRVRLAIELEREEEHRRRTYNLAAVEPAAEAFAVARPERLPAVGEYFLMGEEWLLLRGVEGNEVRVQRAQRGSRATLHGQRTPLQFGEVVVREFEIPWAKERWLR